MYADAAERNVHIAATRPRDDRSLDGVPELHRGRLVGLLADLPVAPAPDGPEQVHLSTSGAWRFRRRARR